MSEAVLSVRDLKVYYHTRAGPVRAVDGISFELAQGEKLGLVGESGSGKTTTALAIMRMIKPPGRIEQGQILLGGVDLLTLSSEEMRRMRAAEVSLVPQAAMNALNPVRRVADQFIHGLRDHGVNGSHADMQERVRELLQSVGLPAGVAERFPHELSGGMKQRVTIAMAISLTPKVIVADEPTSALDVVVQRQVMETLIDVQEQIGSAVLLVGHDMGLMAQFVDRIGVMYAGTLVEIGPVEETFENPLHPYTRLLISSLPDTKGKKRLSGIPGLPPSLLNPPSGCTFHPRCPSVMDHCPAEVPVLQKAGVNQMVSCHLYSETSA